MLMMMQEENQYLANSIDQVKQYPQELQRLIGYSVSKPFLGWVDLEDPIKLLYDDSKAVGEEMR
jgi:ectoine hydroxylase-related dioxygenase (phytanoyl-CoA dioxygenase family)